MWIDPFPAEDVKAGVSPAVHDTDEFAGDLAFPKEHFEHLMAEGPFFPLPGSPRKCVSYEDPFMTFHIISFSSWILYGLVKTPLNPYSLKVDMTGSSEYPLEAMTFAFGSSLRSS